MRVRTWLLEAELSVLFFIVLAPLLAAPLVRLQYRRFGLPRRWPALMTAAIGLYVCSLVAFTMFPLPQITDDFCDQRSLYDYWQTTPFESVSDVADVYRSSGMSATLTSGVLWQVLFNVVFFVPLGFFLAYWWRRSLWASAGIGFGVSLLIEITQGTGVYGTFPCPYRLADVDDLMTNTAGAVIGWGIGRALTAHLPDAHPPRVPDMAAPTLGRRALAAFLDLVALTISWFVLLIVAANMVRLITGDYPTGFSFAVEFGIFAAGLMVLDILIPRMRRLRDSPGISSVECGLVATNGDPAPLSGLIVRAVVRFLPIGLVGPLWLAYWLVDLAVGLVRRDRLTATDLLSRTRVATKESLTQRVHSA